MRKVTLLLVCAMMSFANALLAQFPNMDINGNTLYFDPLTRQIGIGTNLVSDPDAMLKVARGKVQIERTTGNHFLELIDNSASTASFRLFSDHSATDFDLSPQPAASTAAANLNFFRFTTTTGGGSVNFFRPDGSGLLDARIGLNGQSSYFQTLGGKFGIGTSTPAVSVHAVGNRLRLSTPGDDNRFIEMRTDGNELDLNANGGDLYLHSNTGNVQVASFGGHVVLGQVATPTDKLEVQGSAKVHGFDAVVHSRNTLDQDFDLIGTYQGWDPNAVYISGYNARNNPGVKNTHNVYVGGAGSEALVVDLINQKVGVGVLASQIPAAYKLAVDGGIICEELRVRNSAAWPDYVFTDAHNLMSLKEVEQFIAQKGHLPGMPSAAEVEAEGGFQVGDMQRRLVEKVEELTLHTIDVNKRNEELQAQLQQAMQLINQLQQRVEGLEK